MSFVNEIHEDIAENYLELIETYIGLNDNKKAKELCNKVIIIDKKLQSKASVRTAEAYYFLGILHKIENNYSISIEYFNKSQILFKQLVGEKNHYKNKINLYLSDIYLNQNNFVKSIEYAALSMPEDRSKLDEILVAQIKIYKAQYQANNTKIDWHKVLDTLHQNSMLYAKYENYYLGEKSTLSKSEIISLVCNFSVELAFNLYLKTKQKQYMEYGLFFIEANKANTLVQKQNISFIKTDNKLLKLLDDITTKSNQLSEIKLEHGANKSKYLKLEKELFELKQQYELYANKYYKKNNKTMEYCNIQNIQQKLTKKDIYITYNYNEQNSYRIVITKETITFSIIKNNAALNDIVEKYINSIYLKKHDKILANSLYRQLLPNELITDKKHLILSADGRLHNIPFDALIDDENVFMINKIGIEYIFSANLYFNNKKTKNALFAKNMLAIAPTYNNVRFASLSNEKEINDISKNYTSLILTKSNATKQNYFKYAHNKDIIHLATHTKIDTMIPIHSSIVLADTKSTTDYSYLNLIEIMQQPITAKLVTLSACDGSFGKNSKGEGVLHFAWAFRYAGAKNIIISQWQSPDKSTAQLMKYFYNHIRKTKNINAALRFAKLKYLKNADAIGAEPYYWANFIIYSTPEKSFYAIKYLILALILFAILITDFFVKK